MCPQANRAGENRETHQDSLESDHDAEGSGERHVKRGAKTNSCPAHHFLIDSVQNTYTSSSFKIRTELEMLMACNLREFKEYIDNEMIVILGQMDKPTEIFEHVYLVRHFFCY